jgi:hypothetical protein
MDLIWPKLCPDCTCVHWTSSPPSSPQATFRKGILGRATDTEGDYLACLIF